MMDAKADEGRSVRTGVGKIEAVDLPIGSPPSQTKDMGVDYQAIVAFLSDPSSYPERPPSVQVIETHMSLVFVAGERVYELKKPIHLGFVDFTTLEARQRNCEREITLNQRLAPGVYTGHPLPPFSSAGLSQQNPQFPGDLTSGDHVLLLNSLIGDRAGMNTR